MQISSLIRKYDFIFAALYILHMDKLDKFFVLIDWVGGAAENIVIPRSYRPSVVIESQTFFNPTFATKC